MKARIALVAACLVAAMSACTKQTATLDQPDRLGRDFAFASDSYAWEKGLWASADKVPNDGGTVFIPVVATEHVITNHGPTPPVGSAVIEYQLPAVKPMVLPPAVQPAQQTPMVVAAKEAKKEPDEDPAHAAWRRYCKGEPVTEEDRSLMATIPMPKEFKGKGKCKPLIK